MEYRNYILCNLPILRDITNCDDKILEACGDEDILTEENVTTLKTQEKQLRNYNFWSLVMSKADCWKRLFHVFSKSGQTEVMLMLLKGHRDDNADQKYLFVNYLKPLNVRVKKQTRSDIRPADDSYKLKPPGIGLALVVNVSIYRTSEQSRPESKRYTNYLCHLWSQLGYKVIQYHGELTRIKLNRIIKEFVETVYANENFMSFIVYIGCNGENGHLIMTDDNKVSINEWLLNYLKLNVGVFKNKPKFFIIQAPGSNNRDQGEFVSGFQENTMICFLSEPHSVLKFNVNIRNWLLYNMIDVFMREAYHQDLVSMLNEMRTNIVNIFGDETNELIFLENCGMKKLYFNVLDKENLEYSNYFSIHTPYLSAICRQQVSNMVDIIDDCVKENVLTPDDRENLTKNDNDIASAFWKLVLAKENYLNIVRDIFYRRNMPNVVDRLKRAKKNDGSEDEIFQAIENMIKNPLKVKLQRPLHPRRNKQNSHNLQDEFIGVALVINIIEYDKCGLRRHGAEHDTIYMSELWGQMGYKVMRYEGIINKPYFIDIISKLLKKLETANTFCEKKVAQSCIVYLGCHGSDDKLVMSNGELVDLYHDVVFKFTKDYMKDVPKIFIVQASQINKTVMDYRNNEIVKQKLNSMSDLILCFSARRGDQSNRDYFVGSLYVNALTNVFMENAYKMELQEMLSEVNTYMRTKFKIHDDSQMPYFDCYIKNLYFKISP